MPPEVHRAETLEESSRSAAEFICEMAVNWVRRKNSFTLGLAGGNTPRLLYEFLAAPPIATRMPWQNIHLFWGDERWVPPDHTASNFAMAFHSLLSKIGIPSANISRIPTDLNSPKDGAKVYEVILRDLFCRTMQARDSNKIIPGSSSCFDMILLGMGEDGHTASLFPGSQALDITTHWVTAIENSVASPPVQRVTLTLPLINRIRNVVFLISGPKKLKISQTILNDPQKAALLYPAARVRAKERLLWFIAEQ